VKILVEDITSALTGILSGISSLISPAGGTGNASAAYAAVLALPILGGVVAFTRRLIKKSR